MVEQFINNVTYNVEEEIVKLYVSPTLQYPTLFIGGMNINVVCSIPFVAIDHKPQEGFQKVFDRILGRNIEDKYPNVSELLTALISTNPTKNLLHYLNTDDNGTKHKLTDELIKLEKCWNISMSALFIFTKLFPNKIWEIPTNELCTGLINLFKLLEIKKINELAAGSGLLSARLKYWSKTLKYSIKIDTSDAHKFFQISSFKYTNVHNISIKDCNNNNPLIISWVHHTLEYELGNLIYYKRPRYIFLVGSHPDSKNFGNHSYNFHELLLKFNYEFVIMPFKQISQGDYYKYDEIRTDHYNQSKTCVTFYFQNDVVNFVKNVLKKFRKENVELFGEYLAKNFEYHEYDTKLMVQSMNEIQKYYLNPNAEIPKILMDGLYNYWFQNLFDQMKFYGDK